MSDEPDEQDEPTSRNRLAIAREVVHGAHPAPGFVFFPFTAQGLKGREIVPDREPAPTVRVPVQTLPIVEPGDVSWSEARPEGDAEIVLGNGRRLGPDDTLTVHARSPDGEEIWLQGIPVRTFAPILALHFAGDGPGAWRLLSALRDRLAEQTQRLIEQRRAQLAAEGDA